MYNVQGNGKKSVLVCKPMKSFDDDDIETLKVVNNPDTSQGSNKCFKKPKKE